MQSRIRDFRVPQIKHIKFMLGQFVLTACIFCHYSQAEATNTNAEDDKVSTTEKSALTDHEEEKVPANKQFIDIQSGAFMGRVHFSYGYSIRDNH
ncbi:MAG: hypothetical protein HRU20_32585, partial [Pseudomonadales bacterium]|nr:hypothetical protein [Pseudomonadales bacterium]